MSTLSLNNTICNIGEYVELEQFTGYIDETGHFIEKVDWYERISREVLEANPTTLVLMDLLHKKENTTLNDWKSFNQTTIDDYYSGLCKAIYSQDKAKITVKLEGPDFMKYKRSLRVTFTDKLGSIGGTLGLFSGFSLLAIIELFHWICKLANTIVLKKLNRI